MLPRLKAPDLAEAALTRLSAWYADNGQYDHVVRDFIPAMI